MIYLDNAATTFPKPQSVVDAVYDCMKSYGGNAGRGGHYLARKSFEKVYECREVMADFINAESPEQIIFTKNTTEAINLAIKGVIKSGDEIIISSMEHNSVLRSCISMEKRGAKVKIVRASHEGYVNPDDVISAITPQTRLICIIHASNVVGTVNPVREICKRAREKNVLTLTDAAQSGGILPIDTSCGDLIAFAGHKGLYGPFGTGVLYIRKGLKLDTLIEGGTGSLSESAFMPESLPERFEAGTVNTCAIAGLCEGIKFVMREGVAEKEAELGAFFKEQLSTVKGIKLLGKSDTAVMGVLLKNHDCVEVAERLDGEYHIATRAGLHCCPMAHRTLGTISSGLLRFSAGYFNTKDEITTATRALENIIAE